MREIKLTKGKIALVDDADYEELSSWKWCATCCSYKGGKFRPTDKYYAKNLKLGYMHRYLMNYPEGMVVDHIDGNSLNNSRKNLRVITQGENVKHVMNQPKELNADIPDEDLTLEDLM